jgi:hypothetical protein
LQDHASPQTFAVHSALDQLLATLIGTPSLHVTLRRQSFSSREAAEGANECGVQQMLHTTCHQQWQLLLRIEISTTSQLGGSVHFHASSVWQATPNTPAIPSTARWTSAPTRISAGGSTDSSTHLALSTAAPMLTVAAAPPLMLCIKCPSPGLSAFSRVHNKPHVHTLTSRATATTPRGPSSRLRATRFRPRCKGSILRLICTHDCAAALPRWYIARVQKSRSTARPAEQAAAGTRTLTAWISACPNALPLNRTHVKASAVIPTKTDSGSTMRMTSAVSCDRGESRWVCISLPPVRAGVKGARRLCETSPSGAAARTVANPRLAAAPGGPSTLLIRRTLCINNLECTLQLCTLRRSCSRLCGD